MNKDELSEHILHQQDLITFDIIAHNDKELNNELKDITTIYGCRVVLEESLDKGKVYLLDSRYVEFEFEGVMYKPDWNKLKITDLG